MKISPLDRAGRLVALAALLLAASPSLPALADAAWTVSDLAWMAGHWRSDEGGRRSEELWLEPAGGVMVAVSRTVHARGVEFEYLRLEAVDGGVVYQASPGGAAPTPFRLVSLAGQKAVFENPTHDFPQRIVYWRTDAGLCARIEGKIGDQDESAEWCWKRVDQR